MQEMVFQSLRKSKLFGRACPRAPQRVLAPSGLDRAPSSNQLFLTPLEYFYENQSFVFTQYFPKEDRIKFQTLSRFQQKKRFTTRLIKNFQVHVQKFIGPVERMRNFRDSFAKNKQTYQQSINRTRRQTEKQTNKKRLRALKTSKCLETIIQIYTYIAHNTTTLDQVTVECTCNSNGHI